MWCDTAVRIVAIANDITMEAVYTIVSLYSTYTVHVRTFVVVAKILG